MMKTTINEEVVQAIILKVTPYKENDAILHIYTHEYGKIGVLARGIRKLTSKNARACQSLMISELTIRLKKGLSSLVRATPIDYLRHVQEDIESQIVAHYMIEYYYRYINENEPLEGEYHQLEFSLKALNQGYSPLLVYLLFLVYILDHNGISIDVDGCVLCQSQKVVSISIEDGGFLCQDHLKNHQVLSIDLLKAFRHIHKCPINHIGELHIEDNVCKQLIPIMEGFIDEYSGIHLKTSEFIRQIV